MKILITGANGFIAKNLIAQLKVEGYDDLLVCNRNTTDGAMEKYIKECDFVFHLAGVNRPENNNEFTEGNVEFTKTIIDMLQTYSKNVPVLFTSSIQAENNNAYGESKKKAEDVIFNYGKSSGAPVMIYRLPNAFGKWARPNYNSVVATFSYNIANDKSITINDEDHLLELAYIDDIINEFILSLNGQGRKVGEFYEITTTTKITVGQLANKLYEFKSSRENLIMPSLANQFDRNVYATFLSYLNKDDFSYYLNKNEDNRGWLAEFIKSKEMGQIFISKSKPGITRGNHWHHTKVEKFLVVQGEGVISFRNINDDKVIEYHVNGENPEVVDIPPGYTHAIKNTGVEDLITLFWACEIFDQNNPDTYREEV
ncbi:SDR family oxidoreductase [Salicibibacter cibi]|uniref:SDR family oxidoreductase n=1 Tax=Salicibibacter cibi TaxID=2743001 RepID=A0A7T7CFR9_9BACI|nr:NAD-dependent epimerase/dehydratase family protein [Salicibibacter cibi]QQK80450.1 SDR family oxidoreductase [Salicibibacter cibi]